jgi:hypothetical protein
LFEWTFAIWLIARGFGAAVPKRGAHTGLSPTSATFGFTTSRATD